MKSLQQPRLADTVSETALNIIICLEMAAGDTTVDTGGEFPWDVDRPEFWQNERACEGEIGCLYRLDRIRHQCHCWAYPDLGAAFDSKWRLVT